MIWACQLGDTFQMANVHRKVMMDEWDSWALYIFRETMTNLLYIYGYGSIPIHTIFRGMNIHESQLQYFDVNYRGIGF